jgi:signal transduction histidine kinase
MTTQARLKQVGLFTDLPDEDLAYLCRDVTEVAMAPGELLFAEGAPGDQAYVVLDGSLVVTKATGRREAVLAVRGPGTVIGEMALLQATPRGATVRAQTAVRLLAIPKDTFDGLLHSSPTATEAVFRSMIQRMQETNEQLRLSERMAQLGTLTAGVAHELNNPAAAVRRGSQRLEEALERYTELLLTAPEDGGEARRLALALLPDAGDERTLGGQGAGRDALERADREAALEDRLDELGVADAWQLAPDLADAGLTVDRVSPLAEATTPAALADALRLLVAADAVRALVAEVGEGARRLSTIVQALKGYAYLDRAPEQDVDLVRGLEDTLVLLAHKTRGVTIERDYDPELPTIVGLGGELNQVWTNLLDNACDAVAGLTDRTPMVTLRAHRDGDDVVVEVEDNGPGIPAELQPKVFDAFFTTKPPGQGTGLGLQISYRIVTEEHGGSLTVSSQPGRTVFRATLPIHGVPAVAASDPDDPDEGAAAMASEKCEHLLAVENTPKPEGGCEQCLAVGDTWVHLRFCVSCGQIGCCDDSKNRHARKHHEATGHPVMRTKEPGENWAWCFADDMGRALPDAPTAGPDAAAGG